MMSKVKTAVFPIGGLGTRFLPATKAMPKEMLPIVDKPLIQYAFEEAIAAGIERFVFVTGRNKNTIENHFDHAFELEKVLMEKNKTSALSLASNWVPKPGAICFIRQQNPMGLGHAVLCAKNYVDGPFAVLLADELFLGNHSVTGEMVKAYENMDAEDAGNIVGVQEVPRDKVSSYGVIEPNGNYNDDVIKVKSLVEKPKPEDAPSNFTVSGRYVLTPEIFEYLARQEKGAGGEIQLTDSINQMALDNKPSYAYNIAAKRFDCGSRRGFIEANLEFALNIPEMREEVLSSASRILNEYK